MAKKVLEGLVTAWRLAGWPTSRSPSSSMPTTEGVVRAPSAFSITFGCLPSMIATHELVVPRSMPIILLMGTFVALLQWRMLAGAFRLKRRLRAFPVRFRLSFWSGDRPVRASSEEAGAAYRPILGVERGPARAFLGPAAR